MANASLNTGDEERGVVEAVLGREVQLLFWCLRWQFDVCGDGAEVGDDAEDALGLLRAVGTDGVRVGCLLGCWRVCWQRWERVSDRIADRAGRSERPVVQAGVTMADSLRNLWRG